MQSSGGVASADQVVRKPITTALSGPAAGALGSAVVAEIAGFPNVVTLDAGGTSTDLCLIENARPHVTNGGAVGPFPVRIPMIDIETIGTGGGSIAWISREGHLKVGPRSAGAEPGPMCYPNGGSEPTITDANLVLGRIPPALIGGGIALDVVRARDGIAALATRLPGNMSAGAARRTASSRSPTGTRPNAIRQMTIQRGIDPRALRAAVVRRRRPGAVAGRDGPARHAGLHRAAQSRQPLGVRAAGGRLAHRPHRHQGDARGRARSRRHRRHLCRRWKQERLRRSSATGSNGRASGSMREADVRYAGQSMEVRVPAPSGPIDRSFLAGLIDAFHAAHLRTFGYNYAGKQKVELVNFCVSGFGMIDRPGIPKLDGAGNAPTRTSRKVYFDGRFRDTPIYQRGSLPAGFLLEGPAVVEEFGSTTVVFPGQRLTVDDHGILIVRPAEKGTEAAQ